MLKQKFKNLKYINRLTATIITSIVVVGSAFGIGIVKADQYDAQIQALQQQNAANQSTVNSLSSTASSYQDAVNKLQAQIDGLQNDISATQNHITDLNNQITQVQAQIVQQKKTLGEDVKVMYLQGNIPPFEILAGSKDLSDYVNKQTYLNSVADKIKTSLDKIKALQAQLQQQQLEAQGLLKDKQAQESQVQAAQNQQTQLLSYTQGQISAYNQQISNNNSQIVQLRAQQAAANRRLLGGGGSVTYFGACGGSYPADAVGSYGDWGCNFAKDNTIDNWGMLNRECVSYTAWMVYKTYGYMPFWGGSGNANQWPGDAQAYGIPTGSVPKVGSVAISMSGYYGHAMWVTAVSGNMIYVQQYNFNLDGNYSEMWVDGSRFTYIYFGG